MKVSSLLGLRHSPTWRAKVITVLDILMAAGLGMGAALWTYANQIEPRWIETNRLTLKVPGLPEPFRGYRIAQISDIHAGKWMPARRLEKVVQMVNAEQPDLVAVTGDFVTYTYPQAPADIVPVLKHLKATDGVAAVLGNHDYWGLGSELIRHLIQESGMIDLNNNVHTVRREGACLYVAGVDSARERMARLDVTLTRMPAEDTAAAILLAHEPDFADISAATGRFSLQLSGHSHGGQIVVPLLGPPRLPPMGRKFYAGLYKVGDMHLYTNRGIGMVGLPLRFFARPEITILTLT
jgi:predicted MPP superfamily phosphohydrolase